MTDTAVERSLVKLPQSLFFIRSCSCKINEGLKEKRQRSLSEGFTERTNSAINIQN